MIKWRTFLWLLHRNQWQWCFKIGPAAFTVGTTSSPGVNTSRLRAANSKGGPICSERSVLCERYMCTQDHWWKDWKILPRETTSTLTRWYTCSALTHLVPGACWLTESNFSSQQQPRGSSWFPKHIKEQCLASRTNADCKNGIRYLTARWRFYSKFGIYRAMNSQIYK